MRPRATGPQRPAAAPGFTLIELLLVLTLVAAAAGIVAPQLLRWVEGARERAALQALHSALTALPEQAFFAGQAIEVDVQGAARMATQPDRTAAAGPASALAAPPLTLPLPPGWTVRLPAPLRYEANGMTRGGSVEVLAPGRPPRRWQVEPPAGRVREAHAEPAR